MWAGGDVSVANTFLCQQRLALLSVQDNVLLLHISKQLAIHVLWIMLTASSRSLLATWTSGLPKETIWAVTSMGKCARHTIRCDPMVSRDVTAELGCSWGV